MANRVTWTFVANDKYSRVANKIRKKTAAMKAKFAQLNVKLTETSKRLGKLANKFKIASAAAGVAALGFAKSFSSLEKGLHSIYGLLERKDLEKYRATIDSTITKAITEFGISTNESTEALYNSISLLGASKSTFQAYMSAIKLSIGGNANLETATLGISKLMLAYKDLGLTAEEAGDIILVAQQKGGATVNMIASNIGKVAKFAAQMGITAQEYTATMAIMSKDISSEESVTGIKAIINALISATGESAKTLRAYGLPTSAKQLIDAGWTDTLQKINKMIDKNKDHAKKALPAMEAFQAIMTLSGSAVKDITDAVGGMGKGAFEDAFKLNFGTLDRQAKIATQTLVIMAAEIGRELKPAIISVVGVIKRLHEKFQAMNPVWKKVIAFGTLFVTIIAPMLVGLKFLASGLKIALLVLKPFAIGLVAFVATIGWIPLAIAAAVVAFSLLIHNFDLVKEKAIAAWNATKGFIGGLFGGNDVDITGSANITNTSRAEVAIGIQAAPGIVKDIKTKTSGNTPGLNIPIHLVDQF